MNLSLSWWFLGRKEKVIVDKKKVEFIDDESDIFECFRKYPLIRMPWGIGDSPTLSLGL